MDEKTRERMMRDCGPRKPLLTTADALEYAADMLGKMASDMHLVKIIVDITKDKPDSFMKELPPEVRHSMLEPDRQLRSIEEAAQIVRNEAVERRVLDLRELDRLRAEKPADA